MTERQRSVLIAEDYPDFRQRIVALLEPLELTCIHASNGRIAIEIISDAGQDLDLLITDMDMPVNTGWDVIEAAQQHRDGMPVIMQTGEARYTYVRTRAGEYGVPLIDKRDIDIELGPAVRQALGLPADVEA